MIQNFTRIKLLNAGYEFFPVLSNSPYDELCSKGITDSEGNVKYYIHVYRTFLYDGSSSVYLESTFCFDGSTKIKIVKNAKDIQNIQEAEDLFEKLYKKYGE